MESKDIRSLKRLGFFLIIIILWIGFFEIKTYNLSFNGIIQKISYDEKHEPHPTINGKQYDLLFSYNKNSYDTLVVGDIIIKLKGNLYYKLIKK
jgi:hypothetical protein